MSFENHSGELSTVWYMRQLDGTIRYTDLGYKTYQAFFERAGTNIDGNSTVTEHEASLVQALDIAKGGR
jgi:hypothetical protein